MSFKNKGCELADLAVRKERLASKKQIIQNSIEQIEAKQLLQISWLIKSYEDVIDQLCNKKGESKDNLIMEALEANQHMIDSQVETDVLKDLKFIKQSVISRDIPLPNFKSPFTPSSQELPINKSILVDLMFGFLDIAGKAEDLGQNQGAVIKAVAQAKQQKVTNTQNRKDAIAEHTEVLRSAASEHIDSLIASIGETAVAKKYYTDLARGLRKTYQTDYETDDRPYINAIKYVLKQKGIVKPPKAERNTKST
ncbi:hypothetical protein L2737_19685 [Shewanella electrodiphila]|uniref:Uncharacterized protein n=1 Tax=Shewanella electrodiphila TaxID=934143 RepID=A0ABT0KUL1_9GAMM|nr:hypothetical protein [Shewanella electrodiphila]MCL1047527.1 hypothetical protein [Shewanella electrodiphila]